MLETQPEIERRAHKVDEVFSDLIPPRETWTPVDESLHPVDVLRVPLDEAQALQFKAIKYAFTRQYTGNEFYHRYCDKHRVTPDDLKTNDDLEKIPLIPDATFKQHPSGEDFAYWIANIFTGELPGVVEIDPSNMTFDDIIQAFNTIGLEVAYSTGTSGRHSVIPRDKRTFGYFQYGASKATVGIYDQMGLDHALSLFPKPTNTNLWASRAQEMQQRMAKDHSYGLELKITADRAATTMAAEQQPERAQQAAQEMMRKVFETGLGFCERYEKTTDTIGLTAPPALCYAFMDFLENAGKRFEFGERGMVFTGGGWKTIQNEQIPRETFRKQVEEMLGIPETRCLDGYGMVEMNSYLPTCPEGHYFHVPYTWLMPLTLDQNLEPTSFGEWGRFAFIDATAYSYPGFVMTGDRVRIREHCPACDRHGPVLEPGIERLSTEEMRGCAAEVTSALQTDLQGLIDEARK
jgi:long-chain-fatty-acid---luciferin-component ligase